MARQAGRPLSATFVERTEAVGVHGDGFGGYGLGLRVHRQRNGRLSKSWRQRLTINGRRTCLGLGRYPLVTLQEARRKALDNARAVAKGVDPRDSGKPRIPTFREAAGTVIQEHAPHWKGNGTRKAWERVFRLYCFPAFGTVPVDMISSGDVLRVVLPLWREKRATGKQVRQRIGAVMKWAIASGYRTDNAADAIQGALPRNGVATVHHRALHHGQVSQALRAIRGSNAGASVRALAIFQTLTATRPAEARGATWKEIDMDARTWEIPPHRTKGRKPHRVALSGAAVAVLKGAQRLSKRTEPEALVFPSATGRMLGSGTVGALLRRLGFDCVPHGMRSSFRDWCAESGQSREAAEACLGHAVGNASELSYKRTDYLEQRGAIMDAWAAYLSE